jgi:hypothetical protein
VHKAEKVTKHFSLIFLESPIDELMCGLNIFSFFSRFLCSATAIFGCPGSWMKLGTKCFFKSNYPADFDSARQLCTFMFPLAGLAIIDNFEESLLTAEPYFWANAAGANEGFAHYWIGYKTIESEWTWVGKTSVASYFTNWHMGQEPPATLGGDWCAYTFPSRWADANADEPIIDGTWPGYVCQK